MVGGRFSLATLLADESPGEMRKGTPGLSSQLLNGVIREG
jgi:hypothetical protein